MENYDVSNAFNNIFLISIILIFIKNTTKTIVHANDHNNGILNKIIQFICELPVLFLKHVPMIALYIITNDIISNNNTVEYYIGAILPLSFIILIQCISTDLIFDI